MSTGLIVGIVMAAIGATAGLWGSLVDDAQARDEAAAAEAHARQMTRLQLEEAKEKFNAAKTEAERNAKRQEKEADLTDKTLDVSETGLSNDFNTAIDQMYLSQEADAYSWNAAAMQAGSQEGNALASAAASGVRAGSSLSDAVEMESATNAAQLQFSQDAKRRSDNNSLASVLNGLAGNRYSIESNRIGADLMRDDARYLRNSYLEGGTNYNLYQNQKKLIEEQGNYQIAQYSREYKKHEGWNSFANAMIAFHSMGAKGFGTGYNIGNAFNNASSPNYTTTTGGRS